MKKPNKYFVFLTGAVVVGYFAIKLISHKTLPNQVIQTPSPTPILFNSLIDTTKWETNKGKGFFQFGIKVPKGSYVCVGETATGGNDDGCFPEGIYLNKTRDFPYGISFNQTTILNPQLEKLIKTFKYEGYTPSDINFDNATNQIMVSGTTTQKFYRESGQAIEKTAHYVKYLFTKGNYIYMPTIYTDTKQTNLETYKTILSTWKFD